MTSDPNTPQRPGTIPRYARVDVIGGAVMIFIATLVWYGAIGLKVGQVINFGPGAMPRVLASVLLIAGGGLFLHGLLQRNDRADPFRFALRPPLILAIAILQFALFIKGGDFGLVSTPQLGLMVVGPITVFIAGFATPEARPKELLVLSFGLTAAVLVVFPDLLGVPIPVFPRVIQESIPPSFGVGNGTRVVYGIYGILTAILYVTLFGRSEGSRD